MTILTDQDDNQISVLLTRDEPEATVGEARMVEANQTLDSRRIARDHDARIAATAAIGLTSIKPFVEFQTAIFRMIGETCELMARNYEKGLESLGVAVEHQNTPKQ